MGLYQQRHYQDIAAMMQRLYPANTEFPDPAAVQWDNTRGELAKLFAKDNPQFKLELFLKACLPGNNIKGRKA